jgi:hypothetical protein
MEVLTEQKIEENIFQYFKSVLPKTVFHLLVEESHFVIEQKRKIYSDK